MYNWSVIVQKAFQWLGVRAVRGRRILVEQRRANPVKVFIAYDWGDKDEAIKLYDRLEPEDGVKPWLDRKVGNLENPNWKEDLEAALREAECTIICVSPKSIKNRRFFKKTEVPFILDKANGGDLELSTYVLLVKLEQCEVPPRYKTPASTEVELYAVDGYQKLLKTIEGSVNELRDKRGVRYKIPPY